AEHLRHVGSFSAVSVTQPVRASQPDRLRGVVELRSRLRYGVAGVARCGPARTSAGWRAGVWCHRHSAGRARTKGKYRWFLIALFCLSVSCKVGTMRFSPVLLFHICAGILGLLSGTAAMSFRKGSPRHTLAGKIFVTSMLSMAASAVYLAVLKHQNNNVGGGILTFYLVAAAWLTVRRRDGETSIFDWGALLIPLAIGIGAWINGWQTLHSPAEPKDGVPAGMHFFMGTVMLLAAAGDVRMLLRGGVSGAQRIVRHLWRMCFGFFIATGSFFIGQGSKIFPSLLRQSNLLLVPAILPLILLIFWLFRVRFSDAYKRMSMPRVQPLLTPTELSKRMGGAGSKTGPRSRRT